MNKVIGSVLPLIALLATTTLPVHAEKLSGDAAKTDNLIVGILKRPLIVTEAAIAGPPAGMFIGSIMGDYPHEPGFKPATFKGAAVGLGWGLTAPFICAVNGKRIWDQF